MRQIFILFMGTLFGVVLCVPVERQVTPPPSNSLACKSIYHGQCIDTYQYQCMGIAIPGVCGNLTHFNSIDFGALTAIQCCNGWSINNVGHESGPANSLFG